MKNFLQIFVLFISATSFAQSISDYKYISIPQKFADEKANKYALNDLLASKLKDKKFVIFKENSSLNNSCEILKAEIINTSNLFTNKLKVEFKDCNNKSVASFEGISFIKELEPGMREALQNATKGIAVSNPTKNASDINPNILNESTKIKSNNSTQDKAEVYSNGNLSLNKINISANQFILANPNNSVPYAIFKASSKKDVFHVQLENGTSTLGYFEEDKIVVEIPNSDGSFRKEVFSLK